MVKLRASLWRQEAPPKGEKQTTHIPNKHLAIIQMGLAGGPHRPAMHVNKEEENLCACGGYTKKILYVLHNYIKYEIYAEGIPN